MKPTQKFRQMINAGPTIQAGGVADAGQARLVQDVGYPAVYISGAYVNHTRGYPDGTLTLSEIAQRIREVCERTHVPVIADADEGFGGTLKIVRMVREFEAAGAAAIHMEDFATKKHGVPIAQEGMIRHIDIVLQTRKDPDFILIARTDAMAPWRDGVQKNRESCEEEAFQRMLAYCDAGADMVMPMFATNEWLIRYGSKIPKPIVVLGGAPQSWLGFAPDELIPEMTATEIAKYNVKVVIYATNMLARNHRFMKQQYASWLKSERFDATAQDDQDRADANVLIGLLDKEALLNKYGE